MQVCQQYKGADAVSLLLTQPGINDTVRDEQGRTALEAAATPEIAAIVEGELI